MDRPLIHAIEHLRRVAIDLHWVLGSAAVCQDVLTIATDKNLTPESRLLEIIRYCDQGVTLRPTPVHALLEIRPPPLPDVLVNEISQASYVLWDEPHRNRILGRLSARSTIGDMARMPDRDAETILAHIIGLCVEEIKIISP